MSASPSLSHNPQSLTRLLTKTSTSPHVHHEGLNSATINIKTKLKVFQQREDEPHQKDIKQETEFLKFVVQGDLETCHKLLKHKAYLLNCTDEIWGNTPMHYAVKANNIDMVKLLMEYPVNLHIKAVSGFTPLHEAHSKAYMEIYDLLISQVSAFMPSVSSSSLPKRVSTSTLSSRRSFASAKDAASMAFQEFDNTARLPTDLHPTQTDPYPDVSFEKTKKVTYGYENIPKRTVAKKSKKSTSASRK